MMFAALALAVATGVAMAVQSPTNASLGPFVGSLQASLTNFVVGLLASVVLMLAFASGDFRLIVTASPWQLLGGLYGAFMVLAVVIATPRLGVMLLSTMTMLGQLVGGLLVDGLGLLGMAQVPITGMRLGGCALVLAGIVCVHMANRSGGPSAESTRKLPIFMALPFLAGAVCCLQPPTNAALRGVVGTFEASVVSFAGGTLITLVMVLVANKGKLRSYKGAKPWQFTGGLLGALGVVLAAVYGPALGMSLWMAGTMLGQLVGSMVIDGLGLLGLRKIPINRGRVLGAAFIAVGIVCVTAAKLL